MPERTILLIEDNEDDRLLTERAFRRIRSTGRTALLPVVILTSSSEQEDMIQGYTLGANSYVRKPVDSDEFFRVVRDLGLYWLLLNEAPQEW